jgi:hypothetical protein
MWFSKSHYHQAQSGDQQNHEKSGMIAKTGGDNPSQDGPQALAKGCTEGKVTEFTLALKWGVERGYKALAGYDMNLKTQSSRNLREHKGQNVTRTDEQQGAYDVAEHPEGKGTFYADPVRKPTDGDGKKEREQAEGADNNADHRGGGTQVLGQQGNKGKNHAKAGEIQSENN